MSQEPQRSQTQSQAPSSRPISFLERRKLKEKVEKDYQKALTALHEHYKNQRDKLIDELFDSTIPVSVESRQRAPQITYQYRKNAEKALKERLKHYQDVLKKIVYTQTSGYEEGTRLLQAASGKIDVTLTEAHRDFVAYVQMHDNALKRLRENKDVTIAQLAWFDTMFNHLNSLYLKKNINMATILIEINEDRMTAKTWKDIIKLLVEQKFDMKILGARIKATIPAVIIRLMNPSQRSRAIEEIAKQAGKQKAREFGLALTSVGMIGTLQLQHIFKKIGINGTTVDENRQIAKTQQELEKQRKWQSKKLKSGMLINQAAAGLSFKGMFYGGMGLLYTFGALANFASNVKIGEGFTKSVLEGVTDKYTVANAGFAFTFFDLAQRQKSSRPSIAPSLISIWNRPRRKGKTPFGNNEIAYRDNYSIEQIAYIGNRYPVLDQWIMHQGIEVLHGMHMEKQLLDVHGKKGPSIVDLAYAVQREVNKKKGGHGEQLLRLFESRYGRDELQRHLVRLYKLIKHVKPQTSVDLRSMKLPDESRTYYKYIRQLQGLS